MLIGSHVSFKKDQLLGSAKEALSYGANAFMFYTGAPQNTTRQKIDENLLKEAKELLQKENIDIKNIICHAPYIINLANNKDLEKWQFSQNFLKQELERCDKLNVSYLVLHPGSAVGILKNDALQNICDALNNILKNNYQCQILLETMAGKGTECASSLEELKYIIDHVNYDLGVCIDTCHLNDAGYDMSDFPSFLKKFDEIIGISKIKCVHLNDSKNSLASHKDRHANVGYGTIGFDNLLKICYEEKLKDVPKILETPYVGENWEDKARINPPYKFEIEMLKSKKFNPNLLEDINDFYNK